MNWKILSDPEGLDQLKLQSYQTPQVIFKHSTRCAISSMAKRRLDETDGHNHADFHYLDLLKYRALSNQIAEDFKVYHESPQVLLIRNGECIYDESHSSITLSDILAEIKE